MSDNSEAAKNLRSESERLLNRATQIESGRELCDHHWNGSDRCFETYCTGCQKHLREVFSPSEVPFKDDAYCHECSKTDDDRERERIDSENRKILADLKKLAELKAKYE